jgi:type II secretory pathway pseudopilin PulG
VSTKGKDSPGGPSATRGSGNLVGAIVIAVALLAAGFLVKGAIDRTASRLDAVASGLAETQKALQAVAQAQAKPADNRRGPDPSRRYTVNAAGAPALGPMEARVKIFEFSDFQ